MPVASHRSQSFASLFLLGLSFALEGRAQSVPAVGEQSVVVRDTPVAGSLAPTVSATLEGGETPAANAWVHLAQGVPNFRVEAAGTNSFGALFALRGLSNTPYFTEPAISLYADDIPFGGGFSYPTDLLGFSSATVVLGPQTTTFGRSSDGGTVVLIPHPLHNGGDIEATVGNDRERSALLQVGNTRGTSEFFGAVGATTRDGYVVNTSLRQPVDNMNALEAFVRERFSPVPKAEVSIEGLADRHRDGAAPLVPLGGPLFTVNRAHEGATDTDLLGAALKATLDAPFGILAETTSMTRWSVNPYADWLVLPPAIQSTLVQTQTVWNEELRLGSAAGAAAPWTIGGWYSGGTTTGNANRTINGVIPVEISDFGYGRHEAAVFGEATVAPAAHWSVQLGGRLQEVDKHYRQDETAPNPGSTFRFERSDRAFLPRLAVGYSPEEATELSAAVSLGTRPGGFGSYTDKPSLIPFEAEHVVSTEFSARRRFDSGKLSATVRVFESGITHYQIERSFSPTDYFVATAPKARSQGVDAVLEAHPSDGFSARATFGLTDMTLVRFVDPLVGTDYSGHRAPYAPLFTAGASATYASRTGWFGSASLSETGKTFYTEAEDAAYAQAAYLVADVSVGRHFGRWRVGASLNNAFDRRYYGLIIPGVKSGSPGAPRSLSCDVGLGW